MEVLFVQEPPVFLDRSAARWVRNLDSDFQEALVEFDDGSSRPALLRTKQRRRRSDPLAPFSEWRQRSGLGAIGSAKPDPGAVAASIFRQSDGSAALGGADKGSGDGNKPKTGLDKESFTAALGGEARADGDQHTGSRRRSSLGAVGSAKPSSMHPAAAAAGSVFLGDGSVDGGQASSHPTAASLGHLGHTVGKRRRERGIEAVDEDHGKVDDNETVSKRQRRETVGDGGHGNTKDVANSGAEVFDGDDGGQHPTAACLHTTELGSSGGKRDRKRLDVAADSIGMQDVVDAVDPKQTASKRQRLGEQMIQPEAVGGSTKDVGGSGAENKPVDMKQAAALMTAELKKRGGGVETGEPPWALLLKDQLKTLGEEVKQLKVDKVAMQEQLGGQIKTLEKVEKEKTTMGEQLAIVQSQMRWHNLDLYSPRGINRTVALAEVIDQALSFLSFEVRKIVHRDGVLHRLVRDPSDQVQKPFRQYDKCEIDYRTLWRFVHGFDARGCRTRPVTDEATRSLCCRVLAEVEQGFALRNCCSTEVEVQSLQSLLAYMLVQLKPSRNSGVHGMAILDTLTWGTSTSGFVLDARDIALKEVSPEDLTGKIEVLMDLQHHTYSVLDETLHHGLSAVLWWYGIQLSKMAAVHAPTKNGTTSSVELEGTYIFSDRDGRWRLHGEDKTWQYLQSFAARWKKSLKWE